MKITLLTTEEVEKLPIRIRICKTPKEFCGYELYGKCWWWLRSPGSLSGSATDVDSGGYVSSRGNFVDDDCGGVRPALQNLTFNEIEEMLKTKKGYIKLLGTKWIDVSGYLGYACLLKKKCLKRTHRFDDESNDYEVSEIKKFIEKWFNKKMGNDERTSIKS